MTRDIVRISDINIRMIKNGGKLKATVSIVIDRCFAVHDMKIVEGSEKILLVMPSRQIEEGKFQDIVHPMDSKTRSMLERKILKLYQDMTGQKTD